MILSVQTDSKNFKRDVWIFKYDIFIKSFLELEDEDIKQNYLKLWLTWVIIGKVLIIENDCSF